MVREPRVNTRMMPIADAWNRWKAPRQHSTLTREPVSSTSAQRPERLQTISSQAGWRSQGSSQAAPYTITTRTRWAVLGWSLMRTDTCSSQLGTSHTARTTEHLPEARCSSLQVHLTVLQLVCPMIISVG